METPPCRWCGMRYAPEESACPYCRTPRQDPEGEPVSPIESPIGATPIMPAPGLGPYLLKATAALIGFLVIAWGLHRIFPTTLESAWTDFQKEVERTRDPRPRSAHIIAEVATSSFVYLSGGPTPTTLSTSFTPRVEPPQVVPPVAAPQPPPMTDRAIPPGSPATNSLPMAVEAVAEGAPMPPNPAPSFHRVYGVVYDLETIRPIAGAQLLFRTKHGTVGIGMTDAAGHYRIDLTKGNNSGEVTVSIPDGVPGYRSGLFEDKDPPLRERDKDARLMMMSETTDSDLEPVPLRFKQSAELIQFDLVLVPLAKK